MNRVSMFIVTVMMLTSTLSARAADDHVSLFNGKDLTGWKNVNCAPGTFFVKDNMIVTTGTPTGFLRTERHYENFELELEWMHTRKEGVANSGLFVWGDPIPAIGSPYTRGIEVQVLINYPMVDWATNHGDVFAIWGATCKPDRPHPKGAMRCLPSENRVKGAGEWNHYKVIANDGVIKLHVNGKEVSGVSQSKPRRGYLALESEGSECLFRNIKIKELPSTNPPKEEIADEWQGHESIFNGINLDGWRTTGDGWKVAGGQLRAAGQGEMTTERTFGKAEFLFDFKPKDEKSRPVILLNGQPVAESDITLSEPLKAGKWVRGKVQLQPGSAKATIGLRTVQGVDVMNLFVREVKE